MERESFKREVRLDILRDRATLVNHKKKMSLEEVTDVDRKSVTCRKTKMKRDRLL